jgi:hypothetical protein
MKKNITIVLLLLLAGYIVNSILFKGPTEYYLCSDRNFKLEGGSVFYEDLEENWVKTRSEVYEDKIVLPSWQTTKCKEECRFKYIISRLAHNSKVSIKEVTRDSNCRNWCSAKDDDDKRKYRKTGYKIDEGVCILKTK